MDISESELIRAIQAALTATPRPEGALTVLEIKAALAQEGLQISIPRVRHLIRDLQAGGLMAPCRIPSQRIDGSFCSTPAYRWLANHGKA